ncbi:hypothetical protein LCGC14_0622300 [marine sediment metagenome]|uniref:Uncharacterized protein n=1 Tax=marine sediment metagenome TaxID=412755 RepID=A0A0F9R9H8_9ZZZZ
MSLLSVRQEFITKSGRYDLATTTVVDHDTDAGADFYINGGIIDLDLEVDVSAATGWYQEALVPGDFSTTFQRARTIKQVWIEETDGERYQLGFKNYDVLVATYPALDGTTQGNPDIWANNVIHRDPVNSASGSAANLKGIIWMPPVLTGSSVVQGSDSLYYKCILAHTSTADTTPITGGSYTTYWEATTEATGDAHVVDTSYTTVNLLVYALWHSKVLSSNTDENYWTINYETIAVLAALRHLESYYRNTQGWNDYNNKIQPMLIGIDRDVAEAATADTMEMKG